MMTQTEFSAFLNQLLEAERAGAKLLAAYLAETAPRSEASDELSAVQRDEARNCAVLIHLLLEADAKPSGAVGSFYDKGLKINGLAERLAFLNRGQAWVAKRIAEALPRVAAAAARKALREMHDSHLSNIAKCDALLHYARR